ncbi:MAG: ATP-dependent DNA helicase UvrD2 [Propionicimonas sp.]|uniref:ATP-dependent DNA helicase UvrD2 n=1 Tax=Propionicimonas sp. TaxID=1955623 RepID=UPI003D0E1328
MIAEPSALLSGLDPEQAQVATTFGAPVVVIAGAGTGKTRALTHRIAYGVATGAYTANAVLAVTFTTRAAGELRSRLRALGVPAVQARTFHSAALRQAQYFWPRAYGSHLPPVSDERLGMVADAARRLRLAPDASTLRDLLTEVSWAKVTNVSPADYADLAEPAGREVSGLDAAQVGRVLGRYEQVKSDRGVIDFDDILLCTEAMLAEHGDIAEEVRGTYRHLVVDEYQDVNPVQQNLLNLWWGNGRDHCVVGDPAQTIHSFAGATPAFLTGFADRYPDARVVRLVRDYRSSPQVVGMANRVARRTRLGTVVLESQCEPGPEPRVLECASEEDEAATVTRWLVEQHEAGVPWREQAVLYRVHAQSPVFESAFAQAGVPFTVRGGEGFYDRPEVRQVIGTLTERARRDAGEPALDACRDVLARIGWTEAAPSGQGRVRERWESLAAILALAEDVASARAAAGEGTADLGGFVAELNARAQVEHPLSSDGVTLSTLHAAKGLEWTAVALVGVQEGTLPLSLAAGPEQVAEEARLFYVGITRARRNLLLSWSRTRRGSGGRQPSRFLDGITARPEPIARRPGHREKPTSALSATCRVCGKALHTGAERKLRRHADCPPGYDEETYDRLVAWRTGVAAQRSVPAYVVFTDATLMTIAEDRPADVGALLKVPGVGRVKCEQYAADVLAILAADR